MISTLDHAAGARDPRDQLTIRRPQRATFVGQGPNQDCWRRGLEGGRRAVERKLIPNITAEQYAERYCARLALTGACGRKLAAVLGWDLESFLSMPRRNLMSRWAGKSSKGDVFDRGEADVAASALIASNPAEDRYVALGLGVAGCLGVAKPQFLKVQESAIQRLGGLPIFVFTLPHPSGVNRWWNERRNHTRARRALRKFMRGES